MGEPECRNQVAQFVAEGMKSLRRIDSYSLEVASAGAIHETASNWTVVLAALCFCDSELWPFFEELCDENNASEST
jgi:hypothetical protein